MFFPQSPFAPENLVSRDGFGSPVPRQPAHLNTRAEVEMLKVSAYYHVDTSSTDCRTFYCRWERGSLVWQGVVESMFFTTIYSLFPCSASDEFRRPQQGSAARRCAYTDDTLWIRFVLVFHYPVLIV